MPWQPSIAQTRFGHCLAYFHRRVAVAVGVEPAAADDGLIAGHDLDRGGALMRVHPDDHTI
ncbi:hypothetical protein [Micromonospora sp. NPDC005324]|uniref:hypothetical protein n=1 Tax=Micromonospora sp. NPDC005324 TaxID=3157033 RepID=UPI0033A288EC